MATMTRVTAPLLLLLSTSLLNNAQGAFPSPDDKAVLPGFDVEGIRGQFEKVRAQTLKHNDSPPASAGPTAIVGRPGRNQARPGIPVAHITPLSEMVQGSTLNTNNRNLQEGDCSDAATPIFVSSSVFPLMEGCFSPFLVGGLSGYSSSTARILYAPGVGSPDDPAWGADYANSSGGFTLASLAVGNADLLDPTEVAWWCDADGDGAGFTLADDEFSVSCGCPMTSSSAMVTPAPAPSTTVSACGEGDSFSIVSQTLSGAEGCYSNTDFVLNDQIIYTTSGNFDFGQIMMYALELSGDGSSTAGNIHWFLVNVPASGLTEESDFFCVSELEASLYHPSEVPSWQCVEGVTIDVACGCSSSTSTVTSPVSPTTPAPIAPPREQPTAEPASTPSPTPTSAPIPTSAPLFSPGTPTPIAQPRAQPTAEPASTPAPSPVTANEPELTASTCPGDGSFTITSNVAPNMDGCFTAATTTDGESGYTVSGTTALSEFAVFAAQFDDGNFKWIIALIEPDGASVQRFCESVESASDVSPATALWFCDFAGNDENLLLQTDEDISIVCGSCDASVPVVATSDASPACKSGVGAVALGGAGMVAVASAFAGWC